VLAVALAATTAAPAFGQAHGTFAFTGSMHTARAFHTATLLKNGQVLVAGGAGASGAVLSNAELYDPATGKWTVTGSMSTPRYDHTATLLRDGKVLVAGGFNSVFLDSAELYNPSTGKWSTTGSMTVARELQGAALLEDGEVLVAGGAEPWWPGSTYGSPTAVAELYDPTTGRWTATASMNYSRAGAELTLLQNGKALIAGGDEGGAASCTAELFSEGQWSLTADLYFCGYHTSDTAALLTNGDVVIYGAVDKSYASEFYDPSTNIWRRTFGQLYGNIDFGPLALLATGKVLLAGGTGYYYPVSSASIFMIRPLIIGR
jgi:hypothetical protein